MTKAKLLQPNLILGNTIIHLDAEIISEHQLQGLVLDVDETLVPWRQQEISLELTTWIESIKKLVPIWLVSNNLSENRIGSIAEALDLPYLLGARKPSRRKLKQAIEKMNLSPQEVAMVGDRLFTDVLAGNRLGMFTILVEPMIDPAIATRNYPIRNFEVWLSQLMGVSLKMGNTTSQNATKS